MVGNINIHRSACQSATIRYVESIRTIKMDGNVVVAIDCATLIVDINHPDTLRAIYILNFHTIQIN